MMTTEPETSGAPGELRPAIDRAVRCLLAGGLVAYPSETVWGLAAHPASAAGLERLIQVKGREPGKPFQVSCADMDVALRLAQDSLALRALTALWPGPLTVVAPASGLCPPTLAPGGHVGLRVPDHPVALALLRAAGGSLVTTSCNRSGHPPATTFTGALALELADMVLPDGGVPSAGLASTVVALPGGQVVREGSVRASLIGQLLWAVRAEAANRR